MLAALSRDRCRRKWLLDRSIGKQASVKGGCDRTTAFPVRLSQRRAPTGTYPPSQSSRRSNSIRSSLEPPIASRERAMALCCSSSYMQSLILVLRLLIVTPLAAAGCLLISVIFVRIRALVHFYLRPYKEGAGETLPLITTFNNSSRNHLREYICRSSVILFGVSCRSVWHASASIVVHGKEVRRAAQPPGTT